MKKTLLCLLLLPTSILAQEVEIGHKALQLWNSEAMANVPFVLSLWFYFMLATFAGGLFFVRKQLIARWVVGGFILSFFGGGVVAKALGLATLSGYVAIVHLVCWSPAYYLLLTRQPFLREQGALGFNRSLQHPILLLVTR